MLVQMAINIIFDSSVVLDENEFYSFTWNCKHNFASYFLVFC